MSTLRRVSPMAACLVLAFLSAPRLTAQAQEPTPTSAPAPAATPGAAAREGLPTTASPELAAWLHQPEGQARVNRVIEEQRQEAKTETARGHQHKAAQASAVAYAFTPLHGVLIQVGQAFSKAGQSAEARIVYQRLLAENPEPLLRVQATALLQAVPMPAGTGDGDPDATVKVYVERGKEAFHRGNYQETIDAYSSAYAMQELPRLLFNMAQAFRRMAQSERAFLMYHRFLQADPQTTLRRETEGYIEELRLLSSLEGPTYAPRPRWRIATGATALGVGVGLLSFGAGMLAINGQCVTADANGQCGPVLDPSGRPLLPRTAQLYDTTALGASLLTVGVALATAATVLMALPGRRLRAPAAAALSAGPGSRGLRATTEFHR